jgi:asparaginyl-tRNA synthetase
MPGSILTLEHLIRFRKLVLRAIAEYLDSRDWLEVTSSTLTSLTGACEAVGTVFILEHFDRKAHLSQTAQLQLEMLTKALQRKVWTVHRSFRAEPRVTERHLTEFTLIELEAPQFTLQDIMSTQEGILRQCIQRLRREGSKLPAKVVERLTFLENIAFPLQVLEYVEAIRILQTLGFERKWGDNLGIEDEVALLRQFEQQPFFLVRYPADIKYFNMRRSDDGRWAYSVDLIAPPFGEISGGAEREDRFDRLVQSLHSSEMWREIDRLGLDKDDFDWYLSLWKDGCPGERGGFGMGFERLVGFLSGITDIRECVEFPRNRLSISP